MLTIFCIYRFIVKKKFNNLGIVLLFYIIKFYIIFSLLIYRIYVNLIN